MDWRAVVEGWPVSLRMILGWRSPLCIDLPFLGVPEEVMGTGRS